MCPSPRVAEKPMTLKDVEALIAQLSEADQQRVLRILRDRHGIKIHALEARWNTTAEAILEAIDKAGDLTQRGIRGILAEATFRTVVLTHQLPGWQDAPFAGNQSYDLILNDGHGPVRVQVKLQRRAKGIPKLFRGKVDHFVVETQRTRGGKRREAEESRPYRVDEFDVLAVCLHPSTGDWTTFIYCAAKDLLVRAANPTLLEVMQPIPMNDTEKWSADFAHAVSRFRAPVI